MAHTLCLSGMHNFISDSRILTFIIRVAVPVFFIISGFLLFRKMNLKENGTDNSRIWKYIKKTFYLYVIFYFLYSFIAWYVANRAGVGFDEFLRYQVRKFLFVGESAYSWALWYLHGLLLATIIIWALLKVLPRIKIWVFPALALIIWGIGTIIMLVGNERMGVVPGYNTFIFLFERVQRNGIFTGFPFMAIGLWLSQIKYERISAKIVIALLLIGLISGFAGADFGRIALALGIVVFALKIKLKDRAAYNIMGFLSKWIFLLHMAFIFIYVVLIKHRTDSTMGGEELGLFLFTLVTSMGSSLLIWGISKIENRGRRFRCKMHPKHQISEQRK